MHTKLLENHNNHAFLCKKACHRLSKKFYKLSQVLIAKLMDEPLRKTSTRLLNPLATSQWVLGQYHSVLLVFTQQPQSWPLGIGCGGCSLPKLGCSCVCPNESPNLFLTGKALEKMPKYI